MSTITLTKQAADAAAPAAGQLRLFAKTDRFFVVDEFGVVTDVSTHASAHENGGTDEISVLGLLGLLADRQLPLAHAGDHAPDIGSDPLFTAAAVEITDSVNSEGTGFSFSRNDHGHAHGNRGGGALHALAVASGAAGFFDGAEKAKLNAIENGATADQTAGEIEAIVSHDNLLGFDIGEHRIINDAGVSTTELWSSSKINGEVGAAVSGLDIKNSVETIALANITLSGEQTINDVTTSSSRVGVVGQSVPADNGIYISGVGAWTRSTDADQDAEVTQGLTFFVADGTAKGNQYILTTPDPITVGVSVLSFTEVPRVELGTGAGQAAEGNDARIPTQDENDALQGTDGIPSTANRYVTNTDPRNTDSRSPTGIASGGLGGTYPSPSVDGMTAGVLTDDVAHGVRGGGTQHADVIAAGASGFMTGSDKTKLDGIAVGAIANIVEDTTPQLGGDLDMNGKSISNPLGVGGAPAASAQLDAASTTKGFLPPRMTSTQRDAIAAPAAGLEIYDATNDVPNFFNGTEWKSVLNSNAQTLAIGSIPFAVGSSEVDDDNANLFWDNINKRLGTKHLDVAGDIRVSGNLVVVGTKQISQATDVLFSDNHLHLNQGYTTDAPQTGGLSVWYDPSLTIDSVLAGAFVAGDPGVLNPTVGTVGVATFATGDLVQISGSADNDGLYEVLSHAANVLTIRGIGLTGAVEDFTQNDFAANASDSATITKGAVSVLRTGIDGRWERADGSVTPLVFTDLVVEGDPASGDIGGSFPNLTVATVGGTTAAIIGAHPGRTDNPHGVTAGQTGALPLSGGTISGRILILSAADIQFQGGAGNNFLRGNVENTGRLSLFTNNVERLSVSLTGIVNAISELQVAGIPVIVNTRTITAGDGLTGGGDLSANRTLNVALTADAQHGVRGGGTQHANAVAAGASGFMTGADKTKLDGITTGAIANVVEDTTPQLGGNLDTNGKTINTVVGTAIGGGSAAAFRAVSVGPGIEIRKTDAGTDEKSWDIAGSVNRVLLFRTVNDANDNALTWLRVQRASNSTTIDSVAFPNSPLGIGVSSPRASAILQTDSITRGTLAARWTAAQETTNIAALVSADESLTWFNTTTKQFMGWDGTAAVILG